MYLTLYCINNYHISYFESIQNVEPPEMYIKYNKDNSITYVLIPNSKYTIKTPVSFTINSLLQSKDLNALTSRYSYYAIEELLICSMYYEKELFEKKDLMYMSAFKDCDKTTSLLLNLPDIDSLNSAIATRFNFKKKIKEILSSEASLLDLNKSTTTQKCDFQIIVKYIQEDEISLSFKVGHEKFYVVKNFYEFFEDFDSRENVTFGKYLTLKLCAESFTERALKAMTLIRKHCSFYDNDLNFNTEDFIKLLELYKGEMILVSGQNAKILNDTLTASVTIDEEGKFNFDPKINAGEIYIGLDKGFVLNEKAHTIQLISFSNGAQASLYKLGKQINYNFDIVEDLMSEEFKNFTHKAVHLRIKNKEKIDLKINLYISLDLQKNVIFKTIYEYQGQESTKDEIKSLQKFDSLLIEYELRLSELNLLENGKSKDLETLNYVLVADFGKLREISNVYLSDEIANLQKSKLQNLQIKASSGKEWLTVQVSSSDYSQEDLRKILSAYKKKKKYVLLKNDFVTLEDNEELRELAELDDHFNLSEDLSNSEVPIYQIFKLAGLENNKNLEINYDQKIKDIILSIKNFKDKEVKLNENLLKVVRPYQIEAIKWMKTLYDNNLSGILADDMGLGKSIEFISFRTLVDEKAPTLIVCPKSLIYNWRNEFKKRNPTSKCYLVDGNKATRLSILSKAKNTNDVIIVSYDSLRSDIDQFKEIHFAIVCLDEAQYIKNSFTQKSKAVKQLDSTSRFALTGTPIENSLTDLWSIFDFLMPRYLSSEDNFSKEYESTFKNDDETSRKKLLAKITPFILRRSKDDVLTDLPPKTTEVINIAMSSKQSELYNAYVLNTRASIEENPKNKLQILSALTRMRQICVDPSSFLENYNEISPKLEYTTNLVQNAIDSGHKVLIFSQFTSVLEHLQSILKELKISFYYICGDTKANDRLKIADDFNKSKTTKVILVSLKAGGTGLNLHGADTVVHLDPWRNYAVEDQATDRAHRIGQTRPVTVYKLVAHDSIEERVIELQESKKDLYEQVILNGSENITSITDEDIKFLLS